MTIIHQIYCIRAGGDDSPAEAVAPDTRQRSASGPALASSLDAELLSQYYRHIEPHLEYNPPGNVIDNQAPQPRAAEATERLFFVSLAGGVQLLGNVCDGPREGGDASPSCFAHVLLRDSQYPSSVDPSNHTEDQFARPDVSWTGLDALKLWGAAGWVRRQPPDLPAKLPVLESCEELLDGGEPAIDDLVFESFLKQPPEAPEFHDPAGVIPARWRGMPAERRRAWFAQVLAGFMGAAAESGQPLIVVAEPPLAALMFYGVMRLLPEGPRRSQISFSTLETDLHRPRALLAGTWGCDVPSAGEAPAATPWPGTLVNTLGEPSHEAAAENLWQQACSLIEKLCQGGWEAVEEALAGAVPEAAAGGLEADAAQRAVAVLLETGSFPDESWRSSASSISAVHHELARRVVAMEHPAVGLSPVVGGPAHLHVLGLLSAKPVAPGTRKAVIYLLKELPPEGIFGLLKLSGVSDDDKITVLGRYIHEHGELPPGCDTLWDDFAAAARGSRRAGAVLMARTLAKLPPKDLKRLFRSAPREASLGFVVNVFRLAKNNKLKIESLTAVVRQMDEAEVIEFLRSSGPEVLRSYPEGEPALPEKAAELLCTLPRHPGEFKRRLDLILACRPLLPDDEHREAAAAWDTCYHLIHRVGELQKPESAPSPAMRIPQLLNVCRDLAKAADKAMALEAVDQHMTWTQKRDALLRIAQEILGGLPLLTKGPWEHEAILDRISMQLRDHRFPLEPLKREPPPKREGGKKIAMPEDRKLSTSSWGLMLGALAGMIVMTALVVGLAWFFFFRQASTDSEPREKIRRPRREREGRAETSLTRPPLLAESLPARGVPSWPDPGS